MTDLLRPSQDGCFNARKWPVLVRRQVVYGRWEISIYQVGDCIFQEWALPDDGYSIRGSTNPWTDDAFEAKNDECESEMKKEGKDIEKFVKAKCPKMFAKN